MASVRRDIQLDPRFLVPPGVIDTRQDNETNYDYVYGGSDIVEVDDGPVLEYSGSEVPNPPSSFRIVEQIVRIAADGTTVVDVVLEFPDNLGVYDIDVRVTPA